MDVKMDVSSHRRKQKANKTNQFADAVVVKQVAKNLYQYMVKTIVVKSTQTNHFTTVLLHKFPVAFISS